MHSPSCLHPLIHHFLSITLSLSVSDRAVANVLQGGCPGEQYRGEEALGMHSQHYVSRTTNLREFLFFNIYLDSSFPAVVNYVYNLEQHMEVWVVCVCQQKDAYSK